MGFSKSMAFTLNNSVEAAFEDNEVVVRVVNVDCVGTLASDLSSYVNDAINNFWNKVPTSRLKLINGGLANNDKPYSTASICNTGTNCTPNPSVKVDGGIYISCNTDTTDNFTTANILGKTIPNNTSGNKIIGSLILINGTSNNMFSALSHHEKIAVIAHEIGHALGLGHSPVQDSLMYYSSIPNRNSLGWDDIEGITYLYPALQPFDTGCGAIQMINNDPPNASNLLQILLGFLIALGCIKLLKEIKLKQFRY